MKMEHKNEKTDNVKNTLTQDVFLYTDEAGIDVLACKCQNPYCNNFFTKKANSKKNQCGCVFIENGRKTGIANKKENSIYFPPNYNFAVCFYDNYNGFFIINKEDAKFVKEHHCTALINKSIDRVDPVCTINGKQVLLARLIMSTPDDMEVDHINHNTNDLRRCNLRNCTREQNNFNKKKAKQGRVIQDTDGKYIIIDFTKEDVSNCRFDTEEEALDFLFVLQDKCFGEFGQRKSEEISEKHKTDYFDDGILYCDGILKEIQNLNKKNVYNLIYNNIRRDFISKRISLELFGQQVNELITAYKNSQ